MYINFSHLYNLTGDFKKLKPCAAKRYLYSYTHFIVMHFRSTTSKTPIAMATTSKGKLHASTVLRNEYGRSTQLDFVTIDESSDLMNYSLLVSRILEFFVIFLCRYLSTTGLSKKESVVRAEIANIGKLMSFGHTFCLKDSCKMDNVIGFMDLPSGIVGKANSIQHLLEYLKEEEEVDQDYFK